MQSPWKCCDPEVEKHFCRSSQLSCSITQASVLGFEVSYPSLTAPASPMPAMNTTDDMFIPLPPLTLLLKTLLHSKHISTGKIMGSKDQNMAMALTTYFPKE